MEETFKCLTKLSDEEYQWHKDFIEIMVKRIVECYAPEVGFHTHSNTILLSIDYDTEEEFESISEKVQGLMALFDFEIDRYANNRSLSLKFDMQFRPMNEELLYKDYGMQVHIIFEPSIYLIE